MEHDFTEEPGNIRCKRCGATEIHEFSMRCDAVMSTEIDSLRAKLKAVEAALEVTRSDCAEAFAENERLKAKLKSAEMALSKLFPTESSYDTSAFDELRYTLSQIRA